MEGGRHRAVFNAELSPCPPSPAMAMLGVGLGFATRKAVFLGGLLLFQTEDRRAIRGA